MNCWLRKGLDTGAGRAGSRGGSLCRGLHHRDGRRWPLSAAERAASWPSPSETQDTWGAPSPAASSLCTDALAGLGICLLRLLEQSAADWGVCTTETELSKAAAAGSWCQQVWLLLRLLSLACRWPPSCCGLTWPSLWCLFFLWRRQPLQIRAHPQCLI